MQYNNSTGSLLIPCYSEGHLSEPGHKWQFGSDWSHTDVDFCSVANQLTVVETGPQDLTLGQSLNWSHTCSVVASSPSTRDVLNFVWLFYLFQTVSGCWRVISQDADAGCQWCTLCFLIPLNYYHMLFLVMMPGVTLVCLSATLAKPVHPQYWHPDLQRSFMVTRNQIHSRKWHNATCHQSMPLHNSTPPNAAVLTLVSMEA